MVFLCFGDGDRGLVCDTEDLHSMSTCDTHESTHRHVECAHTCVPCVCHVPRWRCSACAHVCACVSYTSSQIIRHEDGSIRQILNICGSRPLRLMIGFEEAIRQDLCVHTTSAHITSKLNMQHRITSQTRQANSYMHMHISLTCCVLNACPLASSRITTTRYPVP